MSGFSKNRTRVKEKMNNFMTHKLKNHNLLTHIIKFQNPFLSFNNLQNKQVNKAID